MASNYTLVSKSDESPAVTSVQNLENGASSEKKLNSGASLCTERVIRMRNRDIPPTLVGIQAISLLLCSSALIISVAILILPLWQVARVNDEKSIQMGLWAVCRAAPIAKLNQSTTCSYWDPTQILNGTDAGTPDFIFYSRAFLLFSIVAGFIGTFLAIVGTGMVCCNARCIPAVQTFAAVFCSIAGMLVGATGTVFPILFQSPDENAPQWQISLILNKAEYFKIDTNSRAPFQYGICLYLCWGTMIIYGVGASLYTFSACLVCSEGHKPRTMRFTSVQTENGTRSSTPRKSQKEKLVSKMETSVSPLTRENLLEHENNHVMHQSSSQFSYDDERNSPTLYAKPPTGLKDKKDYNPVYPEYAEEVKTSNESPNNNKMARTISLQKTFETQTYPSRSQTFPNQPESILTVMDHNSRSASINREYDRDHSRDIHMTHSVGHSRENMQRERDHHQMNEDTHRQIVRDPYEQDCKSSMASVSIIASTNQVQDRVPSRHSDSPSMDSTNEEPVPYMDDLNALAKSSYRLSPGNNDNFTAEVCKVINGQQQDQTIGMFRLSSLDENLELDDERGTTV